MTDDEKTKGVSKAKKKVIIVGAGLAGLTCAWRLVQRGHTVLVLEQRPILGGRTSSWTEEGMAVESGLHKVLGVYRAMPQLLAEVGTALDDIVSWVDAIEIHSPADIPSAGYFTAAPLHKPWRTFRDALSSPYLSWQERRQLARLSMHGIYETLRHPEQIDTISIASYARRYGISEQTIRKFFQPLTAGIFFLPAEQYSVYATFAPIIAGLKNGGTVRVGAFRGGMTEVLINPIAKAIEENGGVIQTETQIVELSLKEERVVGVKTQNKEYLVDHVVIATPVAIAQQLIRPHFANQPWAQKLLQLPVVSTISVQFDLKSPAFTTDHTHLSNTPLVCFAEQSHTTFVREGGRLSGILYPADQLLTKTDSELVDITIQAADTMHIKLNGIERATVVRHPQEFYAMEPGSEALRPLGPTSVPGLTLAGDYIKQPFLASMEGAIISGNRAAAAV